MSDERIHGGTSERPYSAAVADYCNHPRNVGALPVRNPEVGTGTARSTTCQDTVRIQIAVDEAARRVTAARFKAFGCVAAIASASFAAEWLQNRAIDEIPGLTPELILDTLALAPERHHGPELAVSAASAAVADYRAKRSRL